MNRKTIKFIPWCRSVTRLQVTEKGLLSPTHLEAIAALDEASSLSSSHPMMTSFTLVAMKWSTSLSLWTRKRSQWLSHSVLPWSCLQTDSSPVTPSLAWKSQISSLVCLRQWSVDVRLCLFIKCNCIVWVYLMYGYVFYAVFIISE